MSLRIGIDIGGTVTDLVSITGDGQVATHKTASTPHDYGEGIIEGIRALLIDKDKVPQWSPATVAQITDAMIAAYLAPLEHGEDLTFTAQR